MGIRFLCPSGHKLNVKSFLAGKRAICPQCGAKVIVPEASELSAVASSRQDGGVYELASGSELDTLSSVVLDVAESTATVSAIGSDFDPAIPESIVPIAILPTTVIEPIATDAGIEQELRRARSRRNQMTAAIFLLMVVIVLAGVFVWVLRREAASMKALETPPEEEAKTEEKTSAMDRTFDFVFNARGRVFTDYIERG